MNFRVNINVKQEQIINDSKVVNYLLRTNVVTNLTGKKNKKSAIFYEECPLMHSVICYSYWEFYHLFNQKMNSQTLNILLLLKLKFPFN